MLTFRSFTTPNELLDLLFARFSIEPPENLEGGIDAFNVKLKGIRLRYFSFFSMIENSSD